MVVVVEVFVENVRDFFLTRRFQMKKIIKTTIRVNKILPRTLATMIGMFIWLDAADVVTGSSKPEQRILIRSVNRSLHT